MDVMAKPEKTADEANGVSLKSLLENPFLLLPKEDDQIIKDGSDKEQDKQKEKEKELELAYDPFGNVDPMSAFLGPKLWDDSMLYGDKNLKFEFMDIDEFLNEHGILGSDSTSNTTAATTEKNGSDGNAQDKTSGTTLATPAPAADEAAALVQALSPSEVIPMSIETNSATASAESIQSANLPTPPREPSPINVNVDFEVSHTDVALATIPGQEVYDPRQKQFSEEELKPQPMIKKSRKIFVPEEQKDDKYWERRRKNNIAAKRSRDARRVKENQIVLRAAYLQKENGVLKDEVLTLKKENLSLKSVVEKLEKQLKETLQQ